MYERTFHPGETKEIRLYGLGGDDHFHLTGTGAKGILVRMVGGADDDTFVDESKVRGLRKMTRFYDTKKGNRLVTGSEAKNKTSNDPIRNTYDRRSLDFEYNYAIPVPVLAFNPDDGFLLGGFAHFFRYGFHKSPYASSHRVGFNYAFETEGIEATYSGEFMEVWGKLDFTLDARYNSPRYTRNFFGMGNETVNLTGNKDEFYRVQQKTYGVTPGLRRRMGDLSWIAVKGQWESVRIDNLADRFTNASNPDVRPENFGTTNFAGAALEFHYENADNIHVPTKGFLLSATLGYTANLEESDRHFGWAKGQVGFYAGGKNLVLASRAGGEYRLNDDFEFFQAGTLGGSVNLRGFRDERFSGRSVFYHNSDLRLRLFTVKNYYLPFTLGILGGYDYGRVWVSNEDSDKWHHAAGGGIWLSPFDVGVLNFSLFHSNEGNRFQLTGSFLF
ncbi:MAG: hypothetical protein D6714_02830 [Bacteroidetes bacterium]|nr:MAG: hypothetical protein D6714_02830 [Bacteroidota bacterium]